MRKPKRTPREYGDSKELNAYLTTWRGVLNIRGIERSAGIPGDGLKKLLLGKQSIYKYRDRVIELLMQMVIDLYREKVIDPDQLEEKLKYFRSLEKDNDV